MSNLYLVLLRRPRRWDPKEKRSDPFWEFGSFGTTGCHKTNLLRPKTARIVDGDQLAFAQGGSMGVRLVFVTPPVRRVLHRRFLEIRWEPCRMPLRYTTAPVLIQNPDGRSDFQGL